VGRAEGLKQLWRSVERTNEGPVEDTDYALLVWYMRYGLAIDELDAYEHVFDDDNTVIDGWTISEAMNSDEPDVLLLFGTKAQRSPAHPLRAETIKRFAKQAEAVLNAANGPFASAGPQARVVAQRHDFDERLGSEELCPRLVYLTTARATPAVQRAARESGVELHAQEELVDLALALDQAELLDETITIGSGSKKRFVSHIEAGKIAICEVPAADIAEWPGIDDRSLFGLNVRHELGAGRVRRELDAAIKRKADHPNFLAFHNGLTVLCRKIEELENGDLRISGLSVVNGAQSVIAFDRNKKDLTTSLHVLVKFVEAGDDPNLAGEVARRSNTQNPVNPRNLRALDGRQLLLLRQFEQHPRFEYVVRPDTRPHENRIAINNDDAAQWLCSLFLARPWLAVKRTELFRSPSYQLIFHRGISADDVLFAWHVHEAVKQIRGDLPDEYRRSWRLVAVVAVYLVGELLRTDGVDLSNAAGLLKRSDLDRMLKAAALFAGDELCRRHEEIEKGFDDFKVEFKNQTALRQLANETRRRWRRQENND
jgi:hypothetical protein